MTDSTIRTEAAARVGFEPAALAPWWHTAVVLLLLLAMVGFAYLGSLHDAGRAPHRLIGYLVTMAAEWLIFGFIALGARWGGPSLAVLAGRFSPEWRSVRRDLLVAAAYLVVANIVLGWVEFGLGHVMKAGSSEALKRLLPHTMTENAVFLLLALTAGICEEMIFRGYLQRQFSGWTGNATAGIVLQGIAFGAAHAYQGKVQIIVIAVYGCMFGCLAWWRKSLRPGMTAHFLQDAFGGLVLAKFMK